MNLRRQAPPEQKEPGRSEAGFAGGESDYEPESDLSLGATLSVSGLTRPRKIGPTLLPTTVGDYRILGRLGAGGMGVVYEAEQQQPRRRVAVKIMRQGHLVDDLHARMFQREAETLARLKHPNIAAIYESGHTDDGHDFFAMELVREGHFGPVVEEATISRHGSGAEASFEDVPGDLRRGPVRSPARRYPSGPEAIEHRCPGDQRGRIGKRHRVQGPQGEDPGFRAGPNHRSRHGHHRQRSRDAQGHAALYESGAGPGTLRGRGCPHRCLRPGRDSLRNALWRATVRYSRSALVEAVRVICQEPPRPLSLSWRCPELDTDVETIVGMALEKEPPSLRLGGCPAEDVERYLTSLPISARPPSPSYRARRFIRRHRLGVAASMAILLALLLGISGTTVGLVRTKRAETQARRQAESSERVSHFLAAMLGSVDAREVGRKLVSDLEERVAEAAAKRSTNPSAAKDAVAGFREAMLGVSETDAGRRLVDVAILAEVGAAIDERFKDVPEVAGRLEHTLGETYEKLGLYNQALEHGERALRILEGALGSRSRESLRARSLVGMLLYRQGLYDEAEQHLSGSLADQRGQFGERDPDALDSAVKLSWVFMEKGRYEEAERLLRAVLEEQRQVLGLSHRDTVATLNSLAVVYTDQGRYKEAEELHLRLLEIRVRLLGETDPDTIKSLTNLGVVSFHLGRLENAESYFARVLDIQRQELGPEHPTTLGSMTNLAIILERRHRFEEAEALHRESLGTKARTLGSEHPETLSSRYNLAIALGAQGRYEEAELLHLSVYSSRQKLLGESNPDTLDSMSALAGIFALQGDGEEALTWLGKAVARGYRDVSALEEDADFEFLRDDPVFLDLLERAPAQLLPLVVDRKDRPRTCRPSQEGCVARSVRTGRHQTGMSWRILRRR